MKSGLLFLFFLACFAFAGSYHPHIDYIHPLPEQKFVTIHTTIIVKLDEMLNDHIADLANLVSVASENRTSSGETFFSTDNRTIIFKPHEPFPKNAKIDVTLQTSQFGGDDFYFSFYTPADSPNDMDWLPKQSAASQHEIIDAAPVRVINGVAVPSDFPIITTHEIGETAPGRLFFASTTIQGGFGNYIVICENDGTPYFYRRYDSIPHTGNLTVHPNGELSFHCYETYHIVLDHNFSQVDTIYAGHGYDSDDHELQILENGHILQIARQRVKVDMSAVVNGGKPNATVEAHHVQEMDRNKNVIFEWSNWPHLDIRDTYVSLTGGFIDFVHTNSIAIDYDGHYIISPREYKMIVKIHRDTGETIWKLGGRDSDFEFINDELRFSYQHDARPVPGKPDYYTLFDNGRNRHAQYSRGVEYKLDLNTMTAENVWEYRHNPDWYSSHMGSVQRFENGNTLIDFPGGSGIRIDEVNAAGDVVWEMRVSGSTSYRARRFEWDGEMQHPYLILENMGDSIRLIFNKFGDENVAYYNIYTGETESSMALFDSTQKTWLDINAFELANGSEHVFKVSAVKSNGVESGFSNAAKTNVHIVMPGVNAVQQGNFASGTGWELKVLGAAEATGTINADGQYEINIADGSNHMRQVNLQQNNILVMQGKDYVFEFDAYASTPRAIGARVESVHKGNINYGEIDNTALSTRQSHYRYEFRMNYPTDPKAHVIFECGGSEGDVFIDNVSLTYQNVSHTNDQSEILTSFKLYPAYPNPFNPQTTIRYDVPHETDVSIVIYDLQGRRVRTLVDEQKSGSHKVIWDGTNSAGGKVASGLYLYHIKAGDFSETHKVTLLK